MLRFRNPSWLNEIEKKIIRYILRLTHTHTHIISFARMSDQFSIQCMCSGSYIYLINPNNNTNARFERNKQEKNMKGVFRISRFSQFNG